MCDTCLSSISASFLFQIHNIYQGPPGILLSSAPKGAVVEIGGTYTSPSCHLHVTPTTDGWNNSGPLQTPGEGTPGGRCWEHAAIPVTAPPQPCTAGAALDHRHQLLFWQAPGNGCSLPAQDGNRYLNVIATNNSPCHFSFS